MGRAEARRAQQQRGTRRAPRGRAAKGGRAGKSGAGAGKRTGIRRFFTWKKILGTFFGMVLLGMAALVGIYFYVDAPKPNEEATLQSNVYQWSDGSVMTRTGKFNREILPFDKVPPEVRTTFIAIENKNFYKDSGIDIKGLVRGFVSTVTGKGKAGGSTITQQYVKNYYLNQDQTATRKLKEMVISLKTDRSMSKNAILEGYMNTSYFGRGAYGIQAAAQAYYGVDASKLTLEQGAYLAAVLQAPSSYDWATAGDNGKRLVMIRFNATLDNMVGMGELDAAKRKTLHFQEPIKPKPAPGREGQKGYLMEAADAELNRQGVPKAAIDAGGWTIKLNIDKKKQAALEKAVNDELESKLERKNTAERPVDQNVQAGATSVDPKTGAIVAMYGGTGQAEKWSSNALRTDFQPGSTFKPVVLATALQNGAKTQDGKPINPSTLYDGTSGRPVVGSDTPFSPQNQDQHDYWDIGHNITVQKATNASVNSVYAQMTVDAKPEKVKEMGLNLGMRDRDGWPADKPAMALGTMSSSTVEMAGVYATFDHHGKKVTPSIIKSAQNHARTYRPVQTIGDQVINTSTADTVTKVLTGVVTDGSGNAVYSDAYQAAGKTGTTESNVAAWFTGYTPELVTVVAMFGEEVGTGKQVTLTGTAGGGRAGGSSFPAAIWKAYTLSALSGVDTSKFELPDADMGTPPPSPTPTPSAPSSHSPTPAGTRSSSSATTPTPTGSTSRTASPGPTHSSPDPGHSSPDPGHSSPNPTRTNPFPPFP
ncbi:transglycosylase domain-containing protein [Streptomyces sp. G-G2]|uniref:transglycosylase domain-containing protein n=1 Tax=Streptomyces sp. G-G2 TaxID=3046201 RepID=UPI0024BBA623|nr:transglycosylase domain-containing protein [Streptomyces sp. G-G2]MDJ0384182.1 transglycosylase domain-containing protein [Streptomyces sp. G-G2]